MDSTTMIFLLKNNPHSEKYFIGIGFSDSKLKIKDYPALTILNTDSSSGPGEHWCVAFFPKKQKCEYFDPFGMQPRVKNSHDLTPILFQNGAKIIEYNKRKVQSIQEGTCGQHCVYFAILRSRGISMQTILKYYYTNNETLNDRKVSDFVKELGGKKGL